MAQGAVEYNDNVLFKTLQMVQVYFFFFFPHFVTLAKVFNLFEPLLPPLKSDGAATNFKRVEDPTLQLSVFVCT